MTRDDVESRWHVSRETMHRLDLYQTALQQWQTRMNLVADTTIGDLWSRHFADSLQLTDFSGGSRHWVDLGSGAGFPGLIVALTFDRPDQSMTLIESNGKKVAFLREVIRTTSAQATVVHGRIQETLPGLHHIEIVSARALAPLVRLLELTEGMLKTPVKALFLKGRDVEEELTLATKHWTLDYDLHPSVTSPLGRIVEIRQASRKTGPIGQ